MIFGKAISADATPNSVLFQFFLILFNSFSYLVIHMEMEIMGALKSHFHDYLMNRETYEPTLNEEAPVFAN